ncbi:hypothetical protein [Streptomyces erythrochromogenes]|uniref:hypothetical protein n=1 Tax=Streptomyces erythrochromogenes TaxID=285574 RepID=UPI003868DA74
MCALWHPLTVTGAMALAIAWALILGFTLFAVVQAVVAGSRSLRCCAMTDPARWRRRTA